MFTRTEASRSISSSFDALSYLRDAPGHVRSLLSSPTKKELAVAERIGHFYGVDLVRGLAAITILVWHYQSFYTTTTTKIAGRPPDIDRTIQPFYRFLYPIYEHGYCAVEAFWVISGFVFAHVYAGKATTTTAFAGARFARLYPLHLITLITITVLQQISQVLVGENK